MIRYALLCRRDHAFEAWFRDSEAYDVQRRGGHVSCPNCGDLDVRKAVMAPAVRRSAARRAGEASAPAPAGPPGPVPAGGAGAPVPGTDEQFQRLRNALREIHARLKRDAVDVGAAFPDEARAIHEGAAPERAIYGTATETEVRGLVEDGIGIMPIPALPDDRN